MIVRSQRPEDYEMPLAGFLDYLTPVENFFVRSHHYVPQVEAGSWRLTIDGLVERPLTLTYEQLRRLPRVEHVAVLECAGNGRGFFEPSMPGLQWGAGAAGNARWTGVRLADLLRSCGVKEGARHLLLDGADQPVGSQPKFQRTIPLEKALHPDTMLAYEMNGAPLERLHGFPLRLVAPGWASDSWTKWLQRITLLDKEFQGFYMATAYRHPGAGVAPGSAVDARQMKPVERLRVKSVIAAPTEASTVAPGRVTLAGAAWTGESQVTSVDVSLDAGRSWHPAAFGPEASQYGWRLWQLEAGLAPGYYQVMARARDAAGDVQPLVQEWNPSGYLWNVAPRSGFTVAAGAKAPVREPTRRPEWPAPVRNACLGCHEADVVEEQRLSRAQWEREVDKMVQWGAPGAGRESIIDFLSEHFGPRRVR